MSVTVPPLAVDAIVFDAYGTLFDVHSVTARADALLPGRGAALSQLWRTKQLEYTWLQSLMYCAPTLAASVANSAATQPPEADQFASLGGPATRMEPAPREDFAAITAHALDYALDALDAPLDAADRRELCDAYLTLAPYADVPGTLAALAPRPRWILSNGTLGMLEPLVRHHRLDAHLDGILSVDAAGVYKPSPRVYQLALDRLAYPAPRIAFVSSNCWDAVGAKVFGFTTFWINRTGAPVDRHGPPPDCILTTLSDLPPLLGPG